MILYVLFLLKKISPSCRKQWSLHEGKTNLLQSVISTLGESRHLTQSEGHRNYILHSKVRGQRTQSRAQKNFTIRAVEQSPHSRLSGPSETHCSPVRKHPFFEFVRVLYLADNQSRLRHLYPQTHLHSRYLSSFNLALTTAVFKGCSCFQELQMLYPSDTILFLWDNKARRTS